MTWPGHVHEYEPKAVWICTSCRLTICPDCPHECKKVPAQAGKGN